MLRFPEGHGLGINVNFAEFVKRHRSRNPGPEGTPRVRSFAGVVQVPPLPGALGNPLTMPQSGPRERSSASGELPDCKGVQPRGTKTAHPRDRGVWGAL